MIFRKIGVKLLISYVFILTVGILILGFFFAGTAKRFLYEEKKRELLRKGGQIGLTVIGLFNGQLHPETAEKILTVTGASLGAKIMVVDHRGKILAMTPGLRRWRIGLRESDYQQVLAGRIVTRQENYAYWDKEVIFVGTPITHNNGQVAGGVFLFAPLATLGVLISGLKKLVVAAALIGICGSFLLAVFFSRTITAPLVKLKKAATRMAEGDFNIRVAEPDDEIGELSKAFNTMAASLGRSVTALKREKTKIERMLADMSEGVVAVDVANEILFMNTKAGELLKMENEADWRRREYLQPLRELAASVIRTGAAGSVELILADQTWVLGHASLLGETGNFWGTIIVLQDVSELRRVENLRKQLIADLSHELRSPLTVIRGRTEALLDRVIDDEGAKEEYLRGIQAETIRLSDMVRDLLEMARLENNPRILAAEVFCLKEMANAIVGQYRQSDVAKAIRLETEGFNLNKQALVRADAGRIGQVLRNFLDNAFRYARTRIIVRVKEDADTVTLEVEDDGPGIPEAEQPLVWERFYKVNKARTAGAGGVGLGLAIAREIITASGGRIWLASEVGRGTVFGFVLPKDATAPVEKEVNEDGDNIGMR
jgi:two-component system sensor histidine kinase ResE